jgi:two-component system response regulator HydG
MEKAMDHRQLKEENRLLRETLGSHFDMQNIIGRSPVMVKLMETVAQVSPTEATVLITGESGTGKEMIAGATHFNSGRKDGPFVKLNCAAITETLLESELFGHEKGAFTGAYKKKEGRFRQAHGGSLFLDEISEMSLAMQVKLLRVLQEREITRVPLLAQHFLKMFAEKNRKQINGFTPQAMDRLLKYDWPGNVRELMNAVERGVVLSRSDYLDEQELALILKDAPFSGEISPKDATPTDMPLDEVEKATILKTLELTGGNKSEAARRLGVTRKTLHKKLKMYGVMS